MLVGILFESEGGGVGDATAFDVGDYAGGDKGVDGCAGDGGAGGGD